MWVQDTGINKENLVIILKDILVTRNLCILLTVLLFPVKEIMVQRGRMDFLSLLS